MWDDTRVSFNSRQLLLKCKTAKHKSCQVYLMRLLCRYRALFKILLHYNIHSTEVPLVASSHTANQRVIVQGDYMELENNLWTLPSAAVHIPGMSGLYILFAPHTSGYFDANNDYSCKSLFWIKRNVSLTCLWHRERVQCCSVVSLGPWVQEPTNISIASHICKW